MWETGRHVPVASYQQREDGPRQPGNSQLTNTMKSKPKTQCQRLLAYLRKNRKGITTMEAFEHLRITCVHKRIAEINGQTFAWIEKQKPYESNDSFIHIIKTPERTASGSIVTRYKLTR
jgi:hypothetical protein